MQNPKIKKTPINNTQQNLQVNLFQANDIDALENAQKGLAVEVTKHMMEIQSKYYELDNRKVNQIDRIINIEKNKSIVKYFIIFLCIVLGGVIIFLVNAWVGGVIICASLGYDLIKEKT